MSREGSQHNGSSPAEQPWRRASGGGFDDSSRSSQPPPSSSSQPQQSQQPKPQPPPREEPVTNGNLFVGGLPSGKDANWIRSMFENIAGVRVGPVEMRSAKAEAVVRCEDKQAAMMAIRQINGKFGLRYDRYGHQMSSSLLRLRHGQIRRSSRMTAASAEIIT